MTDNFHLTRTQCRGGRGPRRRGHRRGRSVRKRSEQTLDLPSHCGAASRRVALTLSEQRQHRLAFVDETVYRRLGARIVQSGIQRFEGRLRVAAALERKRQQNLGASL